jgi:hypothetical protein
MIALIGFVQNLNRYCIAQHRCHSGMRKTLFAGAGPPFVPIHYFVCVDTAKHQIDQVFCTGKAA